MQELQTSTKVTVVITENDPSRKLRFHCSCIAHMRTCVGVYISEQQLHSCMHLCYYIIVFVHTVTYACVFFISQNS